jgi:hypothetical protein
MALITAAIADAAPYGFADYDLLVSVEKIRHADNELVAAIKALAADDVIHVIPKSWRERTQTTATVIPDDSTAGSHSNQTFTRCVDESYGPRLAENIDTSAIQSQCRSVF